MARCGEPAAKHTCGIAAARKCTDELIKPSAIACSGAQGPREAIKITCTQGLFAQVSKDCPRTAAAGGCLLFARFSQNILLDTAWAAQVGQERNFTMEFFI